MLLTSLGWGPLLVLQLARFLWGAATPQWVHRAAMAAMLAGFIAMLVLYVKFVPLVRR
jgi:hypothetical protein